jgi:hypothetical protein
LGPQHYNEQYRQRHGARAAGCWPEVPDSAPVVHRRRIRRCRPRGGRGAGGRILLKLADRIEDNLEKLARLESLDTGHPLRDSRSLDVPRTALCFRYFGGMADKFEGSVVPVEPGLLNYCTHEPVGVVGQVVPWNFPLMCRHPSHGVGEAVVGKGTPKTHCGAASKIAPALFEHQLTALRHTAESVQASRTGRRY